MNDESTDLLINNANEPIEDTKIATDSSAVFFFDDENLSNHVHNVHDVHTFNIDEAIDPNNAALEGAKLVIDKALIDSKDNAGVLGSDEFKSAIKAISTNQALWFEYRSKIKASKPSGVPMSDIDNMCIQQSADGDRQDSAAAELIELVIKEGQLFFDAQADKAYVLVVIKGVKNTLSIGSKSFIEWLSFTYFMATKRGGSIGKSASESSIRQACFALSGIAKHDGDAEQVHLRVADHNGGHYIFIGDNDLQVIEVMSTGWRITDNSPVKFWKPSSMLALPMPTIDGDLNQLWDFINVPQEDRLLVLAWILESFRENTPNVILAFTGTQGSAKTSTQDKIKQLVDNSAANVKSAPKTVEDIFVSAGCNRVVSYENLSHLTPAMQDALCILATGGAHVTRKHYTNDEESTICVKRPTIINSIPNVLTAQDATDRAITIECPRIEYREESEINAAWEIAKPSIFGGLLDLFVKTLLQMPKVKLVNPPRMADFTRLGEAMAQALGNQAGTFDTLYKANRSEGISRALEASPVGVAIPELIDDHYLNSPLVFSGTMKKLLESLEKYKQESHAWPKSPRGLGDSLRRQSPALNALGINIEISKPTRDGVNVVIKRCEHREHCEHGLKEKQQKEKFTTLESVAIDTEVF